MASLFEGAGGVDGPSRVRQLLAAGAEAVAVGTLLLRTDESGASATHRAALADPRFTRTVITHAFTGRPARGLHNGFIERHEKRAPYGYPALHHLTRGLRAAAAAEGDADRVHLWAGTGFRSAPTGPRRRWSSGWGSRSQAQGAPSPRSVIQVGSGRGSATGR